MSIEQAKRADYSYIGPEREVYQEAMPILSIIIDCYYRLDLVRQSIQSVLDQDYANVELVLVDNGAEPDVRRYLSDVHKSAKNVALIRFAENQFDWNSERTLAICWNAGVIHAKGDYIAHVSYDDMVSPNYATRMVRLFMENPACVTSAPMPVSISEAGQVNADFDLQGCNTRGRYTDGSELAFDMLQGSPRKLIASPGEVMVIKKDLLLGHGGYDGINDLSQVLKYAVMGVSGFDPEASLYWRHHDSQLNKQAKRRGVIWYSSIEKAWADSGVVEIWRERFDADKVKALLAFKKKMLAATPLMVVKENVRKRNARGVASALANMARECPALFPGGCCAVVEELFSMTINKVKRHFAFSK